jgi:cytochrome P450
MQAILLVQSSCQGVRQIILDSVAVKDQTEMGVLQDLSSASTLELALETTTLLRAALLCIVAVPVLIILADYVRVLRVRQRLPPGPVPWPVVGNYFQIPKYKPWIEFEKWARYYDNPMFTIWQGHRPTIMCNDIWSISDLLEKRAHIYSSRPHMIGMGDMIHATDANQVCLVYGDKWRLHRRLMHTATGSQAIRPWRAIQANESKILIRDLMDKPDDFVMAIERYSCSIVSVIGWGRRIDRINDYVAQMALKVMEGVDLIIPGLFLVESIPLLNRLPAWLSWIYPMPRQAQKGARISQRYFVALSKEGAQAPEDNFAKRLFLEREKESITEAEISTLTSNLIGGGVDTTSGTMISFILAMCVFPEKMRKAQEELDRVVGRDRVPDFSDEANLPYIRAVVSETLRWRTVTILGGIPHAPIQDDEYRGYLIPKGTPITGNVWAIHRNENDFPEPDNFRPERFLNGLERPYPTKQGHSAFGWGRRVCSGQPLAEQGLFLSIATLLWAFDFKPGLDENVSDLAGPKPWAGLTRGQGREVQLDIFAYTKSENMRPEPFKARFIPRSRDIERILRAEAARAREELRPYDGESKLTMESVAAAEHLL